MAKYGNLKGVRETKKGGKYFFSFFDNKVINGNTIEALMLKFVNIAWKKKTWTPRH